MKYAYIGAAVAAALSLTGISAHASCADPRTAAQAGAYHEMPAAVVESLRGFGTASFPGFERIVGTWHVTYTTEGAPFADAFIQWHGDGTEWENINLPILSGNICMGSYKRLDDSHFSRNHIGWLYNNGTLNGYFTETETDQVSSDGQSYSGTNATTIYDVNGKVIASVTGTSSATRLSP